MGKITLVLVTALAIAAIAGWGMALRPHLVRAHNAAPGVAIGAAPTVPDAAARPDPLSVQEADAAASVAAVGALPGLFARRSALHRLAAAATPGRLRELIAAAAGLDDINERHVFLEILFSRYAQDDPGAAVRLLMSSELPGERGEILRTIFYDWANRDTESALRGMQQLEDPHMIQAAGDGVLLAHARPEQFIDNQLLSRLPIDYNPGPALAWYLGAHAARDPEGAASQAARIYDPILRRSSLHAVASTWALQDPAAALAFAATLPDFESRWYFEHPIVERWMLSDADALLSAIDALPDQVQRQRLLRNALSEIARRDPQRAVRYAVGDSSHDVRLLTDVLSIWARQDFAAALAAAEANLSGSNRRQALQSMLRNFAAQDPGAALGWALGYDGGAHLSSAVHGAARADPEATVAFLMNLEKVPFPAHQWQSVVGAIAQHDPDLALTMMERIPEQHRTGAIRQIAASLAGRDIQAALEWSDTIDTKHRDQALASIVRVWAKRDAPAAAAYAASSGNSELIGSVVQEYAQHDHRAAFEWLLASDPDGGHMQMVVAVWAQKDPAEAAAVVALHTDKPWVRNALGNITQTWMQRSPDEATAWVATLPENDSTTEAIQNAVRHMAHQSPDAARRWADRLSGTARDNALLGLLSGGQLAPDEGGAIANSVENPDSRYRAFQLLVFRAAARESNDIEAARAILASANLTPEQQQQLLNEFERGQRKR